MTENFECRGKWFLPNAKDKKIDGILKYDIVSGITLELEDVFGDIRLESYHECPIILGYTGSAELTLYKCNITAKNHRLNFYGHSYSSKYNICFILEGIHIDSIEDLAFTKIVSDINNLYEWVDIDAIEEKSETGKFNYYYERPKTIDFQLTDDIKGEFNFQFNSNWSGSKKNITLNQSVQFEMTFKEALGLNEILKYNLQFIKFLALVLYEQTHSNCTSLFVQYYNEDKAILKEIKLYQTLSINKCPLKDPQKMFLSYSDIKDRFPIIINNWYNTYELCAPAYNLFFEHLTNKIIAIENTFLNLTQAAEAFHKMTNIDSKKTEFRARIEDLISKYSNNILNDIIEDKELFVENIVDSRNYYTHYSANKRDKALRGNELLRLSEKLKMLLACSFLQKVGVDSDLLKSRLSKISMFHFKQKKD